MSLLVDGFERRQPLLEPLDIWVWEAAALHGMLDRAICVGPLVENRSHLRSVKDLQDDPSELHKVYSSRGYGNDE